MRTHIQRALTKLGARDRAQLVVIAYQTGLVRAEPSSFRRRSPRWLRSRRGEGVALVAGRPGRALDLERIRTAFGLYLIAAGAGVPQTDHSTVVVADDEGRPLL
ncbi:hypothetical protein ADK57_28350 [Streptomyces sp. MMG1533]|nr:hypothetical protein ADK57_28350 [Streptomyces sp. MMG1533]